MSQRLEYQGLYPNRLTPRYILDRQARRRQRAFHAFLLKLAVVFAMALVGLILYQMGLARGRW